MAKIAVIGAGYVGLTTAACFAHLGHEVVAADVVVEKVEQLNRGELPIFETGLAQLVNEGRASGKLQFTASTVQACQQAEFHYLCVPTPQTANGGVDLSFVEEVAATIAAVLPAGSIIVNKSTVPVGTTTIVEDVIQRSDVSVVSNPEFLREGAAVHDFLHPDRIVIGSADAAVADRVSALYADIDAPIVTTDPVSSELIKYASNAFLATKLTFVNEIATLCENVGADADEVLRGMGFDQRVGNSFLTPGPGWGGSCFPKDTAAMVQIAADAGIELDFLSNVIEMNNRQFARTAAKVRTLVGGDLSEKRVAVWGLTFKAGTDDVRSSPALSVIRLLQDEGARITAFDPTVDQPLAEVPEVSIAAGALEATRDVDVLVVLTEWPQFKDVDLATVATLMNSPRVVDARNLLDRAELAELGFHAVGVGR